MKTMINMMTYGIIAGASMYGGYLLGSSNKNKRKTNASSVNK